MLNILHRYNLQGNQEQQYQVKLEIHYYLFIWPYLPARHYEISVGDSTLSSRNLLSRVDSCGCNWFGSIPYINGKHNCSYFFIDSIVKIFYVKLFEWMIEFGLSLYNIHPLFSWIRENEIFLTELTLFLEAHLPLIYTTQ